MLGNWKNYQRSASLPACGSSSKGKRIRTRVYEVKTKDLKDRPKPRASLEAIPAFKLRAKSLRSVLGLRSNRLVGRHRGGKPPR